MAMNIPNPQNTGETTQAALSSGWCWSSDSPRTRGSLTGGMSVPAPEPQTPAALSSSGWCWAND
jgi:hypothetical protein